MRWTCVSVGIDEPVGRDPRPQAEVDGVAADHPAQVQVPALARGAVGRVGKEEAHGRARAGSSRASRARAGSRRRGAARRPATAARDVGILRTELALEEGAHGPGLGARAARSPGAAPPRRGRRGSGGESRRARRARRRRKSPIASSAGRRARARARRGCGPTFAWIVAHLSVGERRGDPAGDLAVLGRGVAAGNTIGSVATVSGP